MRSGCIALVLGMAAVAVLCMQSVSLALAKSSWWPALQPTAASTLVLSPKRGNLAQMLACNASLCSDACHNGALKPAPATLIVTFGSISMRDFVANWVEHVRLVPSISDQYVVLALDTALYDFCIERNIPVLPAASLSSSTTAAHQSAYVFWDRPAFRSLTLDKVKLYLGLLECGYSLLATDADTVWLSDPFRFIEASSRGGGGGGGAAFGERDGDLVELHRADVLVSVDENFIRRDLDPELVIRDFNTGMLFLRRTTATIAFVAEWAHRIAVSDAPWCDDQSEFNRILRGLYPTPRVAYTHHAAARQLGVTPVRAFEAWPYVPVSAVERIGIQPTVAPDTMGHTEAAALPLTPQVDLEAARAALGGKSGILNALREQVAQGRRPSFWLWNGRIKLATLPLAHFAGGHLFFGERVPQVHGITPAVVHATYQFGDSPQYATGKRQRMREAGLWRAGAAEYFEQGNYLRVVGIDAVIQGALGVRQDAPAVWACDDADDARRQPTITRELGVCYHPDRRVPPAMERSERLQRGRELSNFDPAIPHIRAHAAVRRVLRNAFALAALTRRAVILPPFWCFCMRHWWFLEACAADWHDASQRPLPFRCPMDHNYEPSDWAAAGLDFREPQFLSSPRVPWAIRDSVAALRLLTAATARGGGSPRAANNSSTTVEWRQAGTVIERPLCDDVSLRTRSEAARCRRQVRPRVDDLAAALNTTPLAETRVLEMDAADLARLSECGFYDGSLNSRFAQQMAHAFKGRLQWCSKERNEGERAIEAWARRNGRDPHAETVARFNCTGTDIVEHPSINLKPRNFLHEPPGGYPRWMRQRTNPAWVEPAAAGHAMDAGETTATCADLSKLTV